MKLKEIATLLTSLFFLSTIHVTVNAQTDKKTLQKKGSLQVDSAFKKLYLDSFMVPYSQFEDLHDCKIIIKTKKLKTTMTACPDILSLFLGKKNRRYIIHVNNDENFDGVLLSEVPEDARIGLFAHELMHIRDYESRKVTGVMQRGIQYLSKKGKRNVEHYTDRLTIAAGFGEQLYHWATYVLYDSNASEDYKNFKAEIYMSPVAIFNRTEMSE